MKSLTRLAILSALLLIPLANAAIYRGEWINTTFNTSGDLTIDFTVQKNRVVGSFDFDGPVFGAGDPPPIPFNSLLNSKGNGRFKVLGTGIGDIAGSFTRYGRLILTITNIPGGLITSARVKGKFFLDMESFAATYTINSAAGPLAKGKARAHVHKKPAIEAPSTVRFSGRSGRVIAQVSSNTNIKSIKATANKGARTSVIQNNNYGIIATRRIVVTKLTAKTTIVKIAVVNDDGLRSVKYVRFVKKPVR